MKQPTISPAPANFTSGIIDELKKVSWPSRAETIRLTVIVLLISLIIGFYIGIIDIAFTKVLEVLTNGR